MKSSKCILALIAICLTGCSQSIFDFNNDDEIGVEVEVQNPELEISGTVQSIIHDIAEDYIVYEGYRRSLTISKENAIKLGATAEAYDELCESIAWVNQQIEKTIEKAKNDPNIKFLICQDAQIDSIIYSFGDIPASELWNESNNNNIPILKSPSETNKMPSGYMTASPGVKGSDSFFAPLAMSKVHCNVNGIGLFPYHIVETNVFGGILSASRNGSGELDVRIAACNTSGSIYYTTNCQPGSCSWKGM